MGTFIGTSGIDNFTGLDATNLFQFDVANLAGTDTVTGNSAPTAVDTLEFLTGGTIASAQFAGLTNIEILLLSSSGNTVTVDNALASQGNSTFIVIGQGGNDTVDASSAATSLIIEGAGGADILTGGGGNDTITGGAGGDTIAGGAGTDTANYSGSASGVNVNIATGATSGGDAQGDTLTGIENVTGSNFADSLVGNTGNNVLSGLGGNDEIIAGAGADTLIGGDGDDYLVGQTGADDIQGGAGTDTISLRASNAAVTVNLTTGTGLGGDAQGDTYSGIENVLGSISYDDNITGDANDNELFGYGGNDTLSGGGGNDFIRGSTGTDTVSGGDGDDIIRADNLDIIDGGTGYDSLTPEFAAQTINLNSISGNIDNIEVVDLRGGSTSSLITNAASVVAVTDVDDELVIFGNPSNNVDVGGGWVLDPGFYTRPDPLDGLPVEMVRYVQADGSAEVFIQASAGTPTVNLTVGLATGPVVDVNGAAVNADYAISYTTGTGEAAAVANDATLIEVEGDDISELTITLTSTGSLASGEGVSLSTVGDGLVTTASLTITGEGTDTMTISGIASAATYQDIIREVTYNNPDQTITADLSERTITFVATDDTLVASPPVTTTVTLELGNTAPILIPEVQVSTQEDTAVTASAPQALDFENDTVTYSVITGPSNGSLGVGIDPVTGEFTYTPDPDWSGQDTFVVEVSDGDAVAQTTITVTVDPVNDAPVITGFVPAGTPTEDTSTVFTLSATDADGDTPVILAAVAANGSTSHTGFDVTYTPDANFNGTETITVIVSDGNGGTAVQSFTFTVTPDNDLPTVSGFSTTALEDQVLTGQLPAANDRDGDTVTFVAVTGAATANGGTVDITSTGEFTYTPGADYNGPDSFTFTVDDGTGTVMATVSLNVAAINDAPVATSGLTAVADEDGGAVTISLTPPGTDIDGDTVTLEQAVAANGSVVVSGNDILYTPRDGFFGSDTITFLVSDGNGGFDSETIAVTVNPTNDAPVFPIPGLQFSLNEDSSLSSFVVPAFDADGDTLTYSIEVGDEATNGTAVITDPNTGAFTYMPDPDADGSDSFTVTVTDGTLSSTLTVLITIDPENDAPTITPVVPQTTDENTPLVINLSTDDAEGDTVTITSAVAQSGTVAITGAGQITYTPTQELAVGDSAPDTITVVVSDGNGGFASTEIAVTVDGVNDDPTASNGSANGAENTDLVIDVASLIDDVDGDTLTITSATSPAGSVAISGTLLTLTPAAGFSGPTTISYTVDDGNTGTASGTITVEVESVNDAPVITDITPVANLTTDEDMATNVSLQVSDSDSASLTVILEASNGRINVNPGAGSATVEPNTQLVETVTITGSVADVNLALASIGFVPNEDYDGPAAVQATVSDGSTTSVATVPISVTSVNDAPEAISQEPITLDEGGTAIISLTNIFAEDADDQSLNLSIRIDSLPTTGTLAIGGVPVTVVPTTFTAGQLVSGQVTYTADDGEPSGPLSFTVTVLDDETPTPAESNLLTVGIVVNSVNDAPTTTGIAAQTATEDSAFTLDVTSAFADADLGDTLTLSASGQPDWLVFDPSTGTFSGTPEDGDVGGIITVQATDTSGASVDATFTLSVTPVNDAAVAVDDSRTTREDIAAFAQTIQGTVIANDSDEEGDAFSVTEVNGDSANLATEVVGTYGSLFLFADGSFYYQLDNGTNGLPGPVQELTEGQVEQDVFTYTITGGATADLIINVIGTADAPVISVEGGDTAVGTDTESSGDIDVLDEPLTATGTLTLSDVDLLDTVDVAVDSVALNGATSVGNAADATAVGLATLLPMLTITPANPILDNTEIQDQFTWTFNSDTEGFDFLNAGDSLVIDYTLIATDSEGVDSNPQVVTITITGTNDRPTVDLSTADTVETGNDHSATFIEAGATIVGSGPVNIADATGVTIADPDDPLDAEAGHITTLTVSFTALDAGSEQLILSGALPGTISVNGASTATNLILDGTGASLADFEAALQLIQYEHTADNPTTGDRSITVTVTDVDGATSVPATSTITVEDSNDTPDISNAGGDAVTYTENAAPVTLDANANVAISDPDTLSTPDGVGDYDGASLAASITTGGVPAEDVLSVGTVGGVTVSGSDIIFGGDVVATFSGGSAGADLVITYTADANTTAVNAVAQALQYSNSVENVGNVGADPTVGDREITLTYNDGGNIGAGGAQIDSTGAGELITVSVELDLTQAVHVMDGATAVGTFDTVQEAIDAVGAGTYAPGVNTIHVEPAGTTYAASENITIDVPVTIIGQGAGPGDVALGSVTIDYAALDGATDSVSLQNLSVLNTVTGAANGVTFTDTNGDAAGTLNLTDVVIDGFDGSGVRTSASTGLTDITVNITNATISNNNVAGAGPGDQDINLFNFAGDATFTNVIVTNTLSSNHGIQISGFTGSMGATGDIPGSLGNILFDGVSVTGTYDNAFVYIHGYNNFDGLDFDGGGAGGLSLGGGAGSSAGWAGLFIDAQSAGGTFTDAGATNNVDLTGVSAVAGTTFGFIGAPIQVNGTPTDPNNVTGSDEAETVIGGTGDDTITGNGGDDVILAGAGADTLTGDAGNDFFLQFSGEGTGDSIDGGSETLGDSVVLLDNAATDDNVDVTLAGGVITSLDGATLTNVESVTAAVDTTLDISGAPIALPGDTGTDTLSYAGNTEAVSVDLGAGTATGFNAQPSFTGPAAISGFENATGGSGDDSLTGDSGDNTLTGNSGADAFTGSAGTDTIHGGTATTDDANTTVDSATFGAGTTLAYDNGSGVWTATNGGDVTTLTGIEQVTIDGTTYHLVDQDANGGYSSIQEAINAAADGDTVLVGDGTYVEQIEIDGRSNLTISAANADTVTVEAPATLVQTSTSSSGRETFSIIDVDGSTNIVINDIDVDGNGTTAGLSGTNPNNVGINFRNSSGSLTEVDITGIHDPYPGGTTLDGYPIVSGNQRGVGLQVDNDSLMSFAMTGGSIEDFQKNATVFNFADLNVTGVDITGGGAQPINAQNGIQILNSTGTVSGNTVNDIGYAGPSFFYSGGILAYNNTDLDITNNIVTGTNDATTDTKVVGIFVYDNGAPNSGGSITGNTVTLTDVGIGVYGDIQPDAIAINSNTVSNLDTTDPFYAGVDFEPDAGLAVPFNVEGSDDNDILLGSDAADTLTGLGGDDYIAGNLGDDTLIAGDGDDTIDYVVGDGADTVDGGDHGPNGDVLNIDNSASTTATTFTIGQIVDPTEIVPTTGADLTDIQVLIDTTASMVSVGALGSIRMDEIEDLIITLGSGGDTVTVTTSLGGTSLSTSTIEIVGGTGDDIANIGEIDDALTVGVNFDGGDGIDTVSFAGADADAGVTVDLGAGTATSDGASHTLANVENVIGSDFSDTITGDGEDNVITGGGGDDVISGGAGIDTALFSGDQTDYSITVTGTGQVIVTDTNAGDGDDGSDTVNPDVENLYFAGSMTTINLANPVWVIDGSGNLVDVYGGPTAIQDAIDDTTTLDGMSVYIFGQPTAFAENINVDKALSFVGIDNGNGLPTITVASGNAITIDGLTTTGDVSFDGVNLSGTGTATHGVNVRPGADVGTFSFTNADVSGFGYAGIYSSDNGSNVSDTVDAITIDTVTFSNNGTNNANGASNIKLFGFAGNATIQNVTIEGGTYSGSGPFTGLPEYAIDILGDVASESSAGDATGAPPIGTILLNNVEVTGDFEKNLIAFFNFADLDNLTITDLDLSAGDSVNWGPLFNVDGIAATNIDASGYGIIFPSSSEILAEIQGEKSGQGIVDSNITGTAVGDSIHGKGGNDTLIGLAGDDRLYGSNKNADAETGNDVMEGGAGDDYLDGDGNTTGDIAVFRGSVGDEITVANITAISNNNDPSNGSAFDGWQVNATGLATDQGTDTLNEVEIIETRDGADALVSRILLVGNGGFDTIQAAVDAANTGDTIMIAAGDYSAEGSIVVADKVLTFSGSLAGTSPVTDAASWSDTADQSIIDRFQVTGTGGITLDGVHLLGQSQPTGGDPYSAVQMLGTGGITVINSIVSTDQTATAGVSIATAIEVGYFSTDVTIDNVAFTGFKGEANDFAFGVYVNYNPSVTHNVSITDSFFDLTSNGGDAGIIGLPVATDGREDSSGTYTVTGNTFANTNGGYALAHRDFGGVISSATDFSGVHDNTFTNADYTFNGPDFESGVVRNGSAFAVETGPNTVDGVTYAQIITGVGGNDTAATVDDILTGGTGADYIRGGVGNDVINGGDGADNIDGNAGDDTITGGLGDDIIEGSESNETTGDTAVYADVLTAGDITYSAGSWTVTSATEGTDTLTGIEAVQGADPDGVGPATGRFLLVDTDAEGGFATIQDAVNAAVSGDTILIAPGTYDGDVSLTVPNLSLVAVGNPGEVIVSGPLMSLIGVTPLNEFFEANHPAYTAATGFDIGADGVSVSGITFQGFSNAISIGTSTGVSITDNTFVNNVTGLRKGTEADVQTITISDNVFSQGIHGMTIYAASNDNGAFDGVTMNDNTFMALSEKGMYFEQLSNATLDGNTFDDVGNYGRISPPFGGTDGEFGQAIDINLKFETYENVTFTNTEITDSGNSDQDGAGSPGAFGAAIGIKIRDDGTTYGPDPADFIGQITFDGLTIDGTSTGVRVGEPTKDNQGPDVLLTDVTISNATVTDVENATDPTAGGTTTVELSATQTDLDASASQAPVNVTGNSLANIINGGDGNDVITGGAGADTISGGNGSDTAAYTEAYGAVTGLTWDGTTASVTIGGVTDTITGVGKLEFSDGRTVWLVDDGAGAEYNTLAELFDGVGDEAADGDIILLGAGTYTGSVTIDQSVAIYGPNMGTAGSAARVAEAIIQDGQLRITADGVVVDGIAFANGASLLGQFAGAQVRGENVTIQNSVFDRTGGFGGARGVITESGFAVGLALTANSFSGWATGVYLNPGSTATVSGNEFDGNNVGLSNDGPDAVSVDNNTFANSSFEHVGIGAIDDPTDASFVTDTNTFDVSAPEVSIYPLAGGAGGQVITGSANDDLFNGDMTNTTLGQVFDGGAGDDIINAGGGNDIITDGAGVDIVNLGDGDDTAILSEDMANDTLTGGIGIDTVDLSAIATAVTVNLGGATPSANGATIGNNSLSGFESVIGGLGDDSITGEGGANTLIGGAGADTITGLDGADIIDGGSNDGANDSLRGFANAPGVGDSLEDRFVFSGLFGTDTVTDFEDGVDQLQLTGSSFGALTISTVGSNVEIVTNNSGGNDGTIVLENFDFADVDITDFDFT